MTTPITNTFYESASQMQEIATQRLHRAMKGVDSEGNKITVSQQMEEINKAQADVNAIQAGLNAYKKMLDLLSRSA